MQINCKAYFRSTSALLVLLALQVLTSCTPTATSEADIKKTDSLELALNDLELKSVNVQLRQDPENAPLYNKRALVYRRLKLFEEAENDAKRAIRIDSTNADYRITLVDIYFSENKTRLAKDELEYTTKKYPESINAHLKLAELYFIVKQYQKAIDAVNTALKLDEHNAMAYYIKGSVYRESEDTNRAITSLQTAVEQDSRFADAYYDLGLLHAARKNPLAFDYYRSVLEILPGDQRTLYARAHLLQQIGKIDEAAKEYSQIVAKDNSCADCFFNLGAIAMDVKQDYKTAIEQFTKAISSDGAYGDAYYWRGQCYLKTGNKESARADFKMCLQLNPQDESAAVALNQLGK